MTALPANCLYVTDLGGSGMQESLRRKADIKDDNEQFIQDVIAGLSNQRKYLPAKYFYDQIGSHYYDQICELPEYYPYRAELDILDQVATDINQLTDNNSVVEFGAGSLHKIQPLLDRITSVNAFIPIDISGNHLQQACRTLKALYPAITIKPVVADFTVPVSLGNRAQDKNIGFFPGSTIGNFTPPEAEVFLTHALKTLGKDSIFIIGVDTKKSPGILHAAYNDSAGVTAKFNLNILDRINREMDADIDLGKFEHYAYFNPTKGCVEMHLICLENYTTCIEGVRVKFAKGESIHTESSYKYTPLQVCQMANAAGWTVKHTWHAEYEIFAVYLLEPK